MQKKKTHVLHIYVMCRHSVFYLEKSHVPEPAKHAQINEVKLNIMRNIIYSVGAPPRTRDAGKSLRYT
jgi:hypothetical protein